MSRAKSRNLPAMTIKRVPEVVPACAGCGAFQPECLVPAPDGDGALEMCWLCAHAHVDHECELEVCSAHECECLPEAIYPERVIKARRLRSSDILPGCS